MDAPTDDASRPPSRPMRGRSLSLHSSAEMDVVGGLGLPDLSGDNPEPLTASPSTSSSFSLGSSSSSSEGEFSGDEVGKSREKKHIKVSKKTRQILTTLDPSSAKRWGDGAFDDGKVDEEAADERRLAEQLGLMPNLPSKLEAVNTLTKSVGGSGVPEGDGDATGDGSDAVPSSTKAKPTQKAKKSKPTERDHDYVVKLLLLGDSGVGKTSLMMRYSEKHFSPSLMSTAGVDFKTKYLKVNGKVVKCQIWDTAGQERFHVITQAYYRGAQGIILVYDVSDPTETSFTNVRYWMDRIKCHSSPETQKILLGNKVDVPGKRIDSARGKETAKEYGMKFFETSAKDDTNVSKAFHAIIKDIVERQVAAGAGGGGGGGTPGGGSGGGGGSGNGGTVAVTGKGLGKGGGGDASADGGGKKCVIM